MKKLSGAFRLTRFRTSFRIGRVPELKNLAPGSAERHSLLSEISANPKKFGILTRIGVVRELGKELSSRNQMDRYVALEMLKDFTSKSLDKKIRFKRILFDSAAKRIIRCMEHPDHVTRAEAFSVLTELMLRKKDYFSAREAERVIALAREIKPEKEASKRRLDQMIEKWKDLIALKGGGDNPNIAGTLEERHPGRRR